MRTATRAQRPRPALGRRRPPSPARDHGGALCGGRAAGRHRPVGALAAGEAADPPDRRALPAHRSRVAGRASACSPTPPASSTPSASTAARPCRSPSPTAARSASAAASTGSTVAPDGSRVVVYDYKTGSSRAYDRHRAGRPGRGRQEAAAPRLRAGRRAAPPDLRRARLLLVHPLRGRRRPRRLPGRPTAASASPRRSPRSSDGVELGCFPAVPGERRWIHWLERDTYEQLPRTAPSTACARSTASRRGSARPTTEAIRPYHHLTEVRDEAPSRTRCEREPAPRSSTRRRARASARRIP